MNDLTQHVALSLNRHSARQALSRSKLMEHELRRARPPRRGERKRRG
jgi:hypothetical protein